MKWPTELLLIRHAESAYNNLKNEKLADTDFLRFKNAFAKDPFDPHLQPLARQLNERHALNFSDRETPITPKGEIQARLTGRRMRESGAVCPDVLFVSPYRRTEETLRFLKQEWPELSAAREYREERIREQDHGVLLLYSDWRFYQVLNPEQGKLQRLLGEYDYRFLNGENVPDVRQRTRSWISTLTREYAGKRVMAITHHLTILATRANFERLSPEQFLHLDEHQKPLNCGVTRYAGQLLEGNRSRLKLLEYNKQHYEDAEVDNAL